MFGIPGKQAVTLTPAAIRQISRLMARDNATGLRLGVKKGGCAGMEYTLDYVSEVNPLDEVVEQGGARVMIAPMAQMFLFGTEIDYETNLLDSGFRFRNPNVVDSCGCGESIRFDESLAPGA
ncbi:MAG: iron-sulfur cluster assembly accessory protein [Mangrovicoccus sp.]|nr:iron-sulfur cluster assembly accessory protein [Mangrovicoccus sp.]